MKKNVYEIFEDFKNAKSEREKKQVLVDNATPDFVGFLQCAFDPRVKFLKMEIPEAGIGASKYKPDMVPPGMGYTNMANAMKKTYLFIENHPKRNGDVKPERLKLLLIQILEGLEAREAEMYLAMISKQVKVPGLTPKLVKETFLGIFETPIQF